MLPILAAVAAAFFIFGIVRWRRAVLIALVLAVFEGALRKWFFPQFSDWIYFGKDALLLGAYVGYFVPRLSRRQSLLPHHPATVVLLVFGVLAGFELLNPYLPDILVGIFGIQAYLIYVPLMYMIPAVFPRAHDFRKFLVSFVLLALIPLLLGTIQFDSPPDSPINRYVSTDEFVSNVSTFGVVNRPRITGTFSYITGYTTFLTLISLVILVMVIYEDNAWYRAFLLGVLGLTLVNMLMSGSRLPFLILSPGAIVIFFMSDRSRRSGRMKLILLLCVVIPLGVIFADNLFPDARDAFVGRAENSDQLSDRLGGIVTMPLWALSQTDVFGYGIGTTHQAIAVFLPSGVRGIAPPPAEGEWERIILEVGPIGFGMVLLARLLITWQLWKAYRASRGTEFQPYMILALVYCTVSIPSILVFNDTASLFYWFLAGVGLMAAKQATITSPERPRLASQRISLEDRLIRKNPVTSFQMKN